MQYHKPHLSPDFPGSITPPTNTRLATLRSRWLFAYISTRPVKFFTRSSRAIVKMIGLFLSCSGADAVAVVLVSGHI